VKGKTLLRVIFPGLFVVFLAGRVAGDTGHFEFNAHYGKWSLNLLKSVIEDSLSDVLENDIKDRFLEDIQTDHPTFREKNYSQNIDFDSSGNNYGFEIRWYPGGKGGSFSLGFAIEKTSMKISFPHFSASMEVEDTSSPSFLQAAFQAAGSSAFQIKPTSFHLSFRWDILPTSIVHPYITLGVGAATGTALDEATLTYSYSGSLTIPGEDSEDYSESEVTKTIKQLREEQEAKGKEFALPNFFPFFQLNLGLKGMITKNIHILIDAGILDGFLLRGGLSLRF